LLYIYVNEKLEISWAKKKIKDFHFPDITTDNDYRVKTPKLARELLGLSTSQDWMYYNSVITKKDLQKNIDDVNKEIEDKNVEIVRYKSPITFVPIENVNGYTVYLWTEQVHEKMLGRKFEINSKAKSGQTLYTPSNFDINDYLNFLTTIKLYDIVEKKFHGHWKYKSIKSIFNNNYKKSL
jgi:hypothetical protein